MEHFIIIRFSVIFQNRPELKTDKLFDKQRMDFRFNLFEKYCLPCIINQTKIDFKVIILYDPNLPKEYFEKLENLVKSYQFIYLHCWKLQDKLSSNDWLKPYFTNNDFDKYFITTRLDDDDMINFNLNFRFKRYINKFYSLDNIISFKGASFINYRDDNDLGIYKVKYSSLSVFQSKIHKFDDVNIYGHNHNDVKHKLKVIKSLDCFFQLNHIYENDNRMVRFSKKPFEKITLKDIFNRLKK